MAEQPASPPRQRPGLLIWQGQPLPCLIKAVIYEAGQAAALGIKTPNPALIKRLIEEQASSGSCAACSSNRCRRR